MTLHRLAAGLLAAACLTPALASPRAERPVELHHHIANLGAGDKPLALTLDACSGKFDAELIAWLVAQRIPATLFLTARWIKSNPRAVERLREHLDLFQIENHGQRHVPAVIGVGRTVYGLPGHADEAALRREVQGGADTIEEAFGQRPRWYRSATAMYDAQAIATLEQMGQRIAGFSVNGDAGASLPRRAVEQRLLRAQPGDIVIAHMNRPQSGTGKALQTSLPELARQGFRFVRLDQVSVAPQSPIPSPANQSTQ